MPTSQTQKQRQPLRYVPVFAVLYLFSYINTVVSSFRPDTNYSAHTTENSVSIGDFALKQLKKTLAKLHFRLYASEKSLMELVVFCSCLSSTEPTECPDSH